MLIGALIDGRYRVDALVGEGGFGAVYAAWHVGLGARVALKVPRLDDLPPSEVADAIATFLDEGRMMKRLRHPHVVAALDVGLLPAGADGVALPYLVLEWCDGPTLKEHLAALGRPLAFDEAWALLRPVVDAIAHAHAEGIVHRDVKPANILLVRGRAGLVPRVIDFGIAKRVGADRAPGAGDTRTLSDRRAFTPKYAAPEQLTGLRTGPPTDVHALALVLAEMRSGRPVHATDDDARRAVAEGQSVATDVVAAEATPLREVLARALAARPADRHADAAALLQALDEVAREMGGATTGDVPRPDPAPPRASASLASDDSVMPSSRTARTLSPSASPTAAAGRSRRAWVALGVGAGTAVAAALSAWPEPAAPGGDVTSDAAPVASAAASSTPSTGSPSSSAAGPIAGDTPPRAMSSLTQGELLARAARAGATGCRGLETPQVITFTCDDATIVLRRGDSWGPMTTDEIRTNLRHQAAMYAPVYAAARVATSGSWGLVIATDRESIEGLTRQLLAGIEHGPVDALPQPAESRPIPPRLAAWTRHDVVARVQDEGGAVVWESWSTGPSTVSFVVGPDSGTLTLVEGDPDAWIAAAKLNGAPTAYAIDGDRLLASSGKGRAGGRAFLRSLLGATRARRFAEVP